MQKTYYVASWHVGEGEGLTKLVYDKENDKLISRSLETTTHRTSYFARDNDILYVLTEGQKILPNSSKVTSFKMSNDGLKELSVSDNFASAAPHIMLSHNKKHLYVSGYLSGSLYLIDVDEYGNLSNTKKVFENFGSGPNKVRQESSHLHFAIDTPDLNHICVCDLGTDEILVFKTEDDGDVIKIESIKTPAGYGPRHMVFSKDGKYAYVICEMTYHLLIFAYEGQGNLEFIKDYDLWPECPLDKRQCSAIKLSEDGNTLFTCNRGEGRDAIEAFDLSDPENPVKVSSFYDCKFPRDITLLKDGYIAICNQHGNNIQFIQYKDKQFKQTGLIENILEPVSIIEY